MSKITYDILVPEHRSELLKLMVKERVREMGHYMNSLVPVGYSQLPIEVHHRAQRFVERDLTGMIERKQEMHEAHLKALGLEGTTVEMYEQQKRAIEAQKAQERWEDAKLFDRVTFALLRTGKYDVTDKGDSIDDFVDFAESLAEKIKDTSTKIKERGLEQR